MVQKVSNLKVVKNTGKKDLIAILWANENYNKEKPDTIYYKL